MNNVNKARVKAFINETKEDAMRASSSGSFSKYSFDTFCREHNLYRDGKEYRSGGVVISCPFHTDEAPSFNFNDSMGVFNCFSCGGGNYWKFVYRYRREVLGENVNWYQMINEALQKDPDMMSRLGFSSIYEKKSTNSTFTGNLSKFQFKRKNAKPTTYLELQSELLKRKPSIEQMVYFSLLMQNDVDIDIAYRELIEENRSGEKSYDLAEMEEF